MTMPNIWGYQVTQRKSICLVLEIDSFQQSPIICGLESFWKQNWDTFLFPVTHNDTSQSQETVSSCMQKRKDVTFLVCPFFVYRTALHRCYCFSKNPLLYKRKVWTRTRLVGNHVLFIFSGLESVSSKLFYQQGYRTWGTTETAKQIFYFWYVRKNHWPQLYPGFYKNCVQLQVVVLFVSKLQFY